jgi:hypothetical protein
VAYTSVPSIANIVLVARSVVHSPSLASSPGSASQVYPATFEPFLEVPLAEATRILLASLSALSRSDTAGPPAG